jgi:O-antigen/teichoic acid export membrane protein
MLGGLIRREWRERRRTMNTDDELRRFVYSVVVVGLLLYLFAFPAAWWVLFMLLPEGPVLTYAAVSVGISPVALPVFAVIVGQYRIE